MYIISLLLFSTSRTREKEVHNIVHSYSTAQFDWLEIQRTGFNCTQQPTSLSLSSKLRNSMSTKGPKLQSKLMGRHRDGWLAMMRPRTEGIRTATHGSNGLYNQQPNWCCQAPCQTHQILIGTTLPESGRALATVRILIGTASS